LGVRITGFLGFLESLRTGCGERIFGCKKEEITRGERKLLIEDLHNFYS
jgi:hypothetical protein